MFISALFRSQISLIKREITPNTWLRTVTRNSTSSAEKESSESRDTEDKNQEEDSAHKYKYYVTHPLSLCLEYMESEAYKTTYGDKPVWHIYVRNFKGNRMPDTRKSCVKSSTGKIITASPCPICRDEYLLPHYQNVKLLEQFISSRGGYIFETKKTGVCQMQQFKLKVAIRKAQNYGLLKCPIPHRHYNYSDYIKK